jgi:DNA-binding transcriptional LysR family regulator
MEMLKEMAMFVQVVDAGGFSAAARQLGMDHLGREPPRGRLEAHIGARLLHRTTRSLALTELGQQVHAGSAACWPPRARCRRWPAATANARTA